MDEINDNIKKMYLRINGDFNAQAAVNLLIGSLFKQFFIKFMQKSVAFDVSYLG